MLQTNVSSRKRVMDKHAKVFVGFFWDFLHVKTVIKSSQIGIAFYERFGNCSDFSYKGCFCHTKRYIPRNKCIIANLEN